MPISERGGVTRGCRQGGSPWLGWPQSQQDSPKMGLILFLGRGQGESWGVAEQAKVPKEPLVNSVGIFAVPALGGATQA